MVFVLRICVNLLTLMAFGCIHVVPKKKKLLHSFLWLHSIACSISTSFLLSNLRFIDTLFNSVSFGVVNFAAINMSVQVSFGKKEFVLLWGDAAGRLNGSSISRSLRNPQTSFHRGYILLQSQQPL